MGAQILCENVETNFIWFIGAAAFPSHTMKIPKKNALKSNSFDVRQTVIYAYTGKFGLVL